MEHIELINDDCLKVLPFLPDKSINLILCDLPYGLTNNKADIALPLDKLWHEYERIIKDNGCIALFAQGLFYVDLISSNRKLFRYDIVWDKGLISGFLNAKRMPLRRHEQIAVFYKKQPVFNPQMTKGMPLHSKGKSYLHKPMLNRNYGDFYATDDARVGNEDKYPTSIIKFKKPHPSIAKHPTQKSVECCEWIIKTYTNENDLVLDNCMGVGTTGIAALNTNRRFIGIEIDGRYFEIAKQLILKKDGNAGVSLGVSDLAGAN